VIYRKWESDAVAEIEAQLSTHPPEIVIGVFAGRAGTARRRLRRIADHLELHGYTLHVVDPVVDRSDGRWSTAIFRNPGRVDSDGRDPVTPLHPDEEGES